MSPEDRKRLGFEAWEEAQQKGTQKSFREFENRYKTNHPVMLRRGSEVQSSIRSGTGRWLRATFLRPCGPHQVVLRLEQEDEQALHNFRKGDVGTWSLSAVLFYMPEALLEYMSDSDKPEGSDKDFIHVAMKYSLKDLAEKAGFIKDGMLTESGEQALDRNDRAWPEWK